MNVEKRIKVGFIITIILFISVSAVSLFNTYKVRKAIADINYNWFVNEVALNDISGEMSNLERTILEYILEPNNNEMDKLGSQLYDSKDRVNKYLNDYKENKISSNEELIIFKNVLYQWENINKDIPLILKYGRLKEYSEGYNAFKDANSKWSNLYKNVNKIVELNESGKNQLVSKSLGNTEFTWSITLIFSIVFLIINVVIAIYSIDILLRSKKEIEKTNTDLKNSKDKLKSVLDFSPMPIVLINKNGKFEYMNKKYIELFGYTEKDVPTIEDWFSNAYREPENNKVQSYRWYEYLKDIEKDKTCIYSKESFVQCKNHDVKYVTIAGSMLDDNIILIYDDLTERKIIEDELIKYIEEQVEKRTKQLEKAKFDAENANNAKSIFLANMSHEIRTPLNAILGFTQIMIRYSDNTKKQQQQLEVIKYSGEHLLTLINDVLDMAKIESGTITLKPNLFNLYDFIKDIENMFKNQIETKKLKLNLEISKLPECVFIDEIRLRQALLNILGNAVKFTEKGWISWKVRIEKIENKTYMISEIEDSGHGIDKNEIGNLFKPFEQTEIGQKYGGTGLGLAISKRIVKMMGGDIEVRSEKDIGSCFTVKVEIDESFETAEKSLNKNKQVIGIMSKFSKKKVLIVDDVIENRRLAAEILEVVGFETKDAENGEEAINTYKHWVPDIILMDIKMPTISGYETTRQIRNMNNGSEVPIIAMTASILDEAENRALESGMNDFIRKPFYENELYQIISKHLHIEYLYNEEGPQLNKALTKLVPEELNGISSDSLKKMKDAIVIGDIDILFKIIDESIEMAIETKEKLLKMINNFEYEELLIIFQ